VLSETIEDTVMQSEIQLASTAIMEHYDCNRNCMKEETSSADSGSWENYCMVGETDNLFFK
jgi:hypothetical protein